MELAKIEINRVIGVTTGQPYLSYIYSSDLLLLNPYYKQSLYILYIIFFFIQKVPSKHQVTVIIYLKKWLKSSIYWAMQLAGDQILKIYLI